MASTTEREASLERNNQRARWFHAGVYVSVLGLLLTGWWLWTGQEGRPSVLARVTQASDTDLHTYLGWALAAVAGIGVVLGWRAAATLIRDSVRIAAVISRGWRNGRAPSRPVGSGATTGISILASASPTLR